MPFCDFKIVSVRRGGVSTEVLARAYEGDDAPALSITGEVVGTAYQRTAVLGERTFSLKPDATDQQIEDAVAGWVKKLTARAPIPKQQAAFDRAK